MAFESKNCRRKRIRRMEGKLRAAEGIAAELFVTKLRLKGYWEMKHHVGNVESQLKDLSEQYLSVCRQLAEAHGIETSYAPGTILRAGDWRVPQ